MRGGKLKKILIPTVTVAAIAAVAVIGLIVYFVVATRDTDTTPPTLDTTTPISTTTTTTTPTITTTSSTTTTTTTETPDDPWDLDGDGIGEIRQDFNYVTVKPDCRMFYWLFYASNPDVDYTERPLILWFQGMFDEASTGNGVFESIGPYNLNMEERENSWVRNNNVLFIDAPIGSGFSFAENTSAIQGTTTETAEDIIVLLTSFYATHPDLESAPIHIFGQFYGAKIAVELALQLQHEIDEERLNVTVSSVAIGNGLISPADNLQYWGSYLEDFGYIDEAGRQAVDASADNAINLLNEGSYTDGGIAWIQTMDIALRESVGINVRRITDKLEYIPAPEATNVYRSSISNDAGRQYLAQLTAHMNNEVRPALGIPDDVTWEGQKNLVIDASLEYIFTPSTEAVSRILNETNINVVIYNGNLDLLSCTPGQIQWVENLQWIGEDGFRDAVRESVRVNQTVEGYVKSYENLHFYWINAAGQQTPVDSPVGMLELLDRIITNNSSTTTTTPTVTITTTEEPDDPWDLVGDGFGVTRQDFNYVNVKPDSRMFWWLFYASNPDVDYTERPLILWFQGLFDEASSGHGVFESIGPYNLNMEERENSWVRDNNVLFIDAPIGSGFSHSENPSAIRATTAETAEDIILLLTSFYATHPELESAPIHIFGQFYGAKIAVELALQLQHEIDEERLNVTVSSVAIGNGLISPADNLQHWGLYLEDFGYIDEAGRQAVEASADNATNLLNDGYYTDGGIAWFQTIDIAFRESVGINVRRITDKLEYIPPPETTNIFRSSISNDDSRQYLAQLTAHMNDQVKPALGIPDDVTWEGQKNLAIDALLEYAFTPSTETVSRILNETSINVVIYNGNLDLLSCTPGQIQWVENLQWSGEDGFRNAIRESVRVNQMVEGYVKSYQNLHFYWINAAGQQTPIDSPVGMLELLDRIITNNSIIPTTTPTVTITTTEEPDDPISRRINTPISSITMK